MSPWKTRLAARTAARTCVSLTSADRFTVVQ